jgi:hypothetical protein
MELNAHAQSLNARLQLNDSLQNTTNLSLLGTTSGSEQRLELPCVTYLSLAMMDLEVLYTDN